MCGNCTSECGEKIKRDPIQATSHENPALITIQNDKSHISYNNMQPNVYQPCPGVNDNRQFLDIPRSDLETSGSSTESECGNIHSQNPAVIGDVEKEEELRMLDESGKGHRQERVTCDCKKPRSKTGMVGKGFAVVAVSLFQ